VVVVGLYSVLYDYFSTLTSFETGCVDCDNTLAPKLDWGCNDPMSAWNDDCFPKFQRSAANEMKDCWKYQSCSLKQLQWAKKLFECLLIFQGF